MRHGLTLSGRYLVVRTRLPDRPGGLIKLLSLFADEHANVVSVEHHREGMDMPVTETEVEATLLTRDQEHCTEILEAMRSHGYVVERLK
jgi:threonine dehydratase